jgi:GNAT superfamily N-acetyltransferase
LIHVNAVGAKHRHFLAMARSFDTFELSLDQIPVAFPLVNAALPAVDFETWRNFALPLINSSCPSSSGITALRNEAGYLCGLMVYRKERSLEHGATLAVNLFVALELANRGAAIRALLLAADTTARELGCNTTHIRIGAAHTTLAQHIQAGGYRPDAQVLCKSVETLLLH